VSEIKSSLIYFDLNLLNVSDDILEKKLMKRIKFARAACLKIAELQIPTITELPEIEGKVKGSKGLICCREIGWYDRGFTLQSLTEFWHKEESMF